MHHARIVLDMTHGVVDLYIDGVLWISDLAPVSKVASTDPITLHLGIFGNGWGNVCFDNVQVSELDPSDVDLTTGGLKDVLYANTFDESIAAGTDTSVYRWGNSDATVNSGKYEIPNGKNVLLSTPSQVPLTGKFAFEVDVESAGFTGHSTGSKGIWIKLGSDSNHQEYVNLKIFNNGLKYGADYGTTKTNIYFAPNSTYRVKFIVDMDSHSYDIYINDVCVVESVSFDEAATQIKQIRIASIGANIKVDNLKISQILTPAQ